MGYNREDYRRIKAEYATKYIKAQKEADQRRQELYAVLPEVWELDRVLARTGMDIMSVILSGTDGAEEKIASLKERNRAIEAERAALLVAKGYPADYSDVKYECPLCGDSGYVDGKMCDCMKQALVLAGYRSSGLGGLIGTQRFDNFLLSYYQEQDQARASQARKHLKNFAETFEQESDRNYLLLGSTGLGKTHLSTAVAQAVIERGFDVFYVTAVGMQGDFEGKRFGSDEEKKKDLSRYYETDLLIIDDLGTELVNQFTLSYLYDVLNTRINNRRATMINTNLTKTEIEDKYNERITSRLFGEYLPLLFSGEDIRKQKMKKK